MTMRQIMVRAHELARTMIGDYSARLALALRQVWQEARAASSVTTITRKTKADKEYTVTYGWQQVARPVWADGHKIVTHSKEFVFDVAIEQYGEVEGAYLSANGDGHGPSIIGKVWHNGKQYRIVMQIDDATYAELQTAKEGRNVSVVSIETHSEYCHHCNSECFGDCKAS